MGEIPNPLAITGSSLVMISVIGKEQASRPIYADQCCRCDRIKEAVDYRYRLQFPYNQCFGSGSVRIRIIWPDPFQTIRIRIRVAPKTYQNHEKNSTDSPKSLFFATFRIKHIVNIVYMKNIAKHLIGETRFTELKLPLNYGNGSQDPDPYQNKTDPKHCLTAWP